VSPGRGGLLALLLAGVLLAGGCGGDGAGSTEEWAGGVCTSLSEWIEDVDGSLKSLGDEGLGLDAEDVRETVVEVRDATDELADDLRELGRPETESVERAEEELEALEAELRAQLERIERAAETSRDPLEFAATVAMALAVAANEVEQTFRDLQQLDPGSELEQGFRDADACDELRQQVEDID
jgi:DNA repair exonuclease SbcCD ATPase subunit